MLAPNQSFVVLPDFVNITSCEYCFFDLCLSLIFRKHIKSLFHKSFLGNRNLEFFFFFFLDEYYFPSNS